MTGFARYRAVAALAKLEGLAHALRLDLSKGAGAPPMETLDAMEDDLDAVRAAVMAPEEATPRKDGG